VLTLRLSLCPLPLPLPLTGGLTLLSDAQSWMVSKRGPLTPHPPSTDMTTATRGGKGGTKENAM